MEKLHIFVDGASRGNIGDAAVGFTIYNEKGDILKEFSKCIGVCTNNTAEYTALIEALEQAAAHSRGEVVCFSDSELVIRQMNGQYRIKKSHLRELYSQVKDKERMYKKVTYVHVPRTNPKIIRVDKLANKALDEGY